jgi:hypothetical protein
VAIDGSTIRKREFPGDPIEIGPLKKCFLDGFSLGMPAHGAETLVAIGVARLGGGAGRSRRYFDRAGWLNKLIQHGGGDPGNFLGRGGGLEFLGATALGGGSFKSGERMRGDFMSGHERSFRPILSADKFLWGDRVVKRGPQTSELVYLTQASKLRGRRQITDAWTFARKGA